MEREHSEVSGNLKIPEVLEGQNGTAAVIRDMVENTSTNLGKVRNTRFKEVLGLRRSWGLAPRQRGLLVRSNTTSCITALVPEYLPTGITANFSKLQE